MLGCSHSIVADLSGKISEIKSMDWVAMTAVLIFLLVSPSRFEVSMKHCPPRSDDFKNKISAGNSSPASMRIKSPTSSEAYSMCCQGEAEGNVEDRNFDLIL